MSLPWAISMCLWAKLLVCSFDGGLAADHSDFGRLQPVVAAGFQLTPPGRGCPANPQGRALDAGFSSARPGRLAFEIPPDADLRQGTIELWFRPAWGSGHRSHHCLVHIKLEGGRWHGIWLGYHGTIGPNNEAFGANIMDGLDHPCYVWNARELRWKPGQWHHVAFTWTEHSEWLFIDGRLWAKVRLREPLRIGRNRGQISIGAPWNALGPIAGGLIDELRICDVPLYCPGRPPKPMRRPEADIGLGLGWLGAGAKARASSVHEPEVVYRDVPNLHNGRYGDAVPVGHAGQGFVEVVFPEPVQVAGVQFSRDGREYAGPRGIGQVNLLPWPIDFVIEARRDGRTWQQVRRVEGFVLSPDWVAKHTALRFRFDFPPIRCRHLRLRILRGPRGKPTMLMDEFAAFSPAGKNLCVEPGVVVTTALSTWRREYSAAKAIDGRWGEESCWRGKGKGPWWIEVELPRAQKVSAVEFSRSFEGLQTDGCVAAGKILLSADGQRWEEVAQVGAGGAGPRRIEFQPRTARAVRLLILKTVDGKEPVIDELRIY